MPLVTNDHDDKHLPNFVVCEAEFDEQTIVAEMQLFGEYYRIIGLHTLEIVEMLVA